MCESVTIEIHETGNGLPGMSRREYIATVQVGALVWHIFRVRGVLDA